MEKILDKNLQIVVENEKLMANILHDIKSPLYSIKVGLKPHLNNELNRDIFETVSNTLNYIENFLLNYSFKQGKFNNKIEPCNVKEIILSKIDDYKYIFRNKNIETKVLFDDSDCIICNIYIFISSIIGNLISNIAFHAKENSLALIQLQKKEDFILIEFKNNFRKNNDNFTLGLEFCQTLAKCCKIELKFQKTQSEVKVFLTIPNIN